MKLIILSNMLCDYVENDDNFFTMLNEDGFRQADKLDKFIKTVPDIIFCSPYLGALQSVFPICDKFSLNVNVDSALYPIDIMNMGPSALSCGGDGCLHDGGDENWSLFNRHNHNELSIHYEYLMDIINHYHTTSIFSNNIPLYETESDIKNRLFPFLYDLINKYKNTDKIILLVSHSLVCDYILKYFKKSYRKFSDGNFISIDIPKSCGESASICS